MKKENALRLITGFATVLLATTCLASPAGVKSGRVRVAAIEKAPATAPQVLNKAKDDAREQDLIAMGKRIQEEAMSGTPVATNLKTALELPASCVSEDTCSLAVTVENKGNIPVMSPVLGSMSLGLAGGANAVTSTSGWTCGYADPKLTCASTGVVMQPGEKARFVIDWWGPKVAAEKSVKVCYSLVWPARPKEGVMRAEQIAAVQYALKRAGFETGGIDGRIRPKTLQAIRLLREVVGIPGPSQITPDLLQNLFGEVGKISQDADPSDDTACGDLALKPADKKPEEQVIAGVSPQKAVPPVPPKAPEAPAIGEKEAEKPAVTANEQAPPQPLKVEKWEPSAPAAVEKKPAPEVKTAAPSAQPKTPEAKPVQIAKQETPPQKAVQPAAPKAEKKQAWPLDEKQAAKPEKEQTAHAKAPEKSEARLEPSESTPKNKTIVRSTIAPEAYPNIDMSDEIDETYAEDMAAAEAAHDHGHYVRTHEPVVAMHHDNRDGGVYRRSAEETEAPQYYEVNRDAGSYRLASASGNIKPARRSKAAAVSDEGFEAPSQDCVCQPVTKSENARPRKTRKAARLKKRHRGYLPTGAEIMAGWPYRN